MVNLFSRNYGFYIVKKIVLPYNGFNQTIAYKEANMYKPKENFEIRSDARYLMRGNLWEFWRVFGVYLLIVIALNWLLSLPFSNAIDQYTAYYEALTNNAPVPKEVDFSMYYLYRAIAFLASIVIVPIIYGVLRFTSLQVRSVQVDNPYSLLFEKFKDGKKFGKTVGAYALSTLLVALWSLLLFIPGIIKGLSYSLVPYILYDEPELSIKDTLKKSEAMMKGFKGKLFLLYLSFFGWVILIPFTFGILSAWVIPYILYSQAKFYEEMRRCFYNDDPAMNPEENVFVQHTETEQPFQD